MAFLIESLDVTDKELILHPPKQIHTEHDDITQYMMVSHWMSSVYFVVTRSAQLMMDQLLVSHIQCFRIRNIITSVYLLLQACGATVCGRMIVL